jgi:hypothetical protein
MTDKLYLGTFSLKYALQPILADSLVYRYVAARLRIKTLEPRKVETSS